MNAKRLVPALSAVALGLARTARADPTLTSLASFDGTNLGGNPNGYLVADAAGNLYGTTQYGGGGNANNDGTVFELSGPTHQTLTTLATFTGAANGPAYPTGGLAIDAAGNLYGTTSGGGASGSGTVFELSGSSHQLLTTLVAFNGSNGSTPYATLAADAAGNLYGTTVGGGTGGAGTAFELSGSTHQTLTTLANFNGTNGGAPYAPLTLDAAGNLYGTTYRGGTTNQGTAYELSGPTLQSLTTLVSFNASSGYSPYAGLTADAAGTLYGTTYAGGPNGSTGGTVYELSGTAHQTFATLIGFNTSTGTAPEGRLAIDAIGTLYGTTSTGGPGNGTVYSLSGPVHQTAAVVATFTVANGSYQFGGLLPDAAGVLYGTLTDGGGKGFGSAFSLANSGFALPAVTVANNSTYTFAAPTAPGNNLLSLAGLKLNLGSRVVFSQPTNPKVGVATKFGGYGLAYPPDSNGLANSTVDLGRNDGIVSAPGVAGNDLAAITLKVAQGYAGGTWTGPGLTSSAAAADATRTTALGVIQNNQSGTALYTSTVEFDGNVPVPSDVLVKYTYYGDANLDGKVDGADYGQIDAGHLSGGGLTGWYNGDFNYDGVVNASDYTLIDNAFNEQTKTLGIAALPEADLGLAPRAVPEPAGLSVAAAVCFLRRRRR